MPGCDGRDNLAVLIAGADAVVLCTTLTVAKEIMYSESQKEVVAETACSDSPGFPGRCIVNRTRA